MKMIEVTVWVLVDDAGDYAVGAGEDGPGEARQQYEENVQPLAEAGGFRMVQVKLAIPAPELSVIELTATAPELAAASALAS